MPRATTLTTVTRRWIRDHSDQLPGKGPHLQQLLMLAQSMDADLKERGRVQGAHSTAYGKLMGDLEEVLNPSKVTGSRAAPNDEGLFGPGNAGGAELVG